MKNTATLFFILFLQAAIAQGQTASEKDILKTPYGNVEITFLGHGTLMIAAGATTVHIDPWGRVADYSSLPGADMILVTHHHGDHLDSSTVDRLRKDSTIVVATALASLKIPGATVMKNGDRRTFDGVGVEAVPAYNLVHKRPDGAPFHPRGEGNGYVLTVSGLRIYVAGDTENTPEMKSLKNIDIAFLPMNLPYTMTPAMVADAVKSFRPKIFYPYHYGETDMSTLLALLKDVKSVEVRVREMK